MKVKIVLFDAYKLALEGVRNTIKNISDFKIIGAFTTAEDMLACLNEEQADVAVLDLMLKSSEELDVVEKIKQIQDSIKIIVLMDPTKRIVYKRAQELGVNAFLKKDTSASELIGDIINVAKGNDVVPDFLMPKNPDTILSETELRILELLVDEYTNEDIAKELFISRRTVETHVTSILQKLSVNSRTGAVREAIKLKLVK